MEGIQAGKLEIYVGGIRITTRDQPNQPALAEAIMINRATQSEPLFATNIEPPVFK